MRLERRASSEALVPRARSQPIQHRVPSLLPPYAQSPYKYIHIYIYIHNYNNNNNNNNNSNNASNNNNNNNNWSLPRLADSTSPGGPLWVWELHASNSTSTMTITVLTIVRICYYDARVKPSEIKNLSMEIGRILAEVSLWTWEVHPLELRLCSSQALRNP